MPTADWYPLNADEEVVIVRGATAKIKGHVTGKLEVVRLTPSALVLHEEGYKYNPGSRYSGLVHTQAAQMRVYLVKDTDVLDEHTAYLLVKPVTEYPVRWRK